MEEPQEAVVIYDVKWLQIGKRYEYVAACPGLVLLLAKTRLDAGQGKTLSMGILQLSRRSQV